MKINFAGILFAVVGIVAPTAWTTPVTSVEAESAARAFVARGNTLGSSLGATVEKAVEHQTDNGAAFFTVKMLGGGTIITAGDTDLDPIVAIVPGAEDLSTIDRDSPLWVLLNGDLSNRKAASDAAALAPIVSAGRVRQMEAAAISRGKWESLLSEDEVGQAEVGLRKTLAVAVPQVSGIGDLRVDSLVKTKWNQSGHGENTYTPNNYVCGCVATAMAQLMRYHCWPRTEVPTFSNADCAVDGVTQTMTARGGVYDWANMPLAGGSTDAQKSAVGTLTYDCGVAVGMDWGSLARGGSGAVTAYVAAALRTRFGYANAESAYNYDGLDVSDAGLGKMLYSCLDAGYPVQLGISEDHANGHSILGDGYGFVDGISYVHLNMGWSGTGDAWYHFPEIEYVPTSGGSGYTANMVNTCVYNVFPDVTGNVLSGRVLDDEGTVMANASVTIYQGTTEITNVKASATGVWAAVLPSGTYSAIAKSADDTLTGELDAVKLTSANLWGQEIEVSNPSVWIGSIAYSSLDAAVAVVGEGDEIVISSPTVLKKPCEVNVSCTIRAMTTDPADAAISAAKGATLTIGAGARVLVSHVAFTSAADAGSFGISVAAGGTLALSDVAGISSVKTADETGLELAGPLTESLDLIAPNTQAGGIIGICTNDAAAATAALILNPTDEELGGAVREGLIKWGIVPVEDAAAVARIVTASGEKTNFRSMRTLVSALSGVAEPAEIVIMKDAVLTNAIQVAGNLVFRGEKYLGEGAPVVTQEKMGTGLVSFDVQSGGSLVLSNVTFSSISQAQPFLTVAAGGAATLSEGTMLTNVVNTVQSGTQVAPLVIKGLLSIESGVSIVGCSSTLRTAKSGAIYLAKDATLNMTGGEIRCCLTKYSYGGGIYADKGSAVALSGEILIADNKAGNTTDNLSIATNNTIEVVGPLAPTSQIGVRNRSGSLNAAGKAFAMVSETLTIDERKEAQAVFVNNQSTYSNLRATCEGENLLWTDQEMTLADLPGYVEPGDAANAVCCVVYESGNTNLWSAFDYAVASLGGLGASAEPVDLVLLADNSFADNLTITGMVRLCSADGLTATLTRDAGTILVPTGACFSVSNVVMTSLADPAKAKRLIGVIGGRLELLSDTVIEGVESRLDRGSSPVVIDDDGSLVMHDGVAIRNCHSRYGRSSVANNAHGGGLLVENSEVTLLGGEISGCSAYEGGGLYLGNSAKARISGTFSVFGNTSEVDGSRNDIFAEVSSTLVMDGALARACGYVEGLTRDPVIFGEVSEAVAAQLSAEELQSSATNFFHDVTYSLGVIVTNAEGQTALAWARKLGEPGDVSASYTDENGVVWTAIAALPVSPDPPNPPVEPMPVAFTAIVEDPKGVWNVTFTNLVEFCNYEIYQTSSLTDGFDVEGLTAVTNFTATADGPCTLSFPANGTALFWKVVAKPGIKP